jgi:hypothetical protein
MAYAGENDLYVEPLRHTAVELRDGGWEVAWLSGLDHAGAMDAHPAANTVCSFLDRVLLGA